MPTRNAISGATPNSATPIRMNRNDAPHRAASTVSRKAFLGDIEGGGRGEGMR
jgi:hypothetical protein